MRRLARSRVHTKPIKCMGTYIERVEDTKEECCICRESLAEGVVVKPRTCTHMFHQPCLQRWFESSPWCPVCRTFLLTILGTQPVNGTEFDLSISEVPLPGWPNTSTLVLKFVLESGVQTHEHPHPGSAFDGMELEAFLPWNEEGCAVLGLLQKAWERRLLFRVENDRAVPNGFVLPTQREVVAQEGYLLGLRETLHEVGVV